jgi:hypothetical protein
LEAHLPASHLYILSFTFFQSLHKN